MRYENISHRNLSICMMGPHYWVEPATRGREWFPPIAIMPSLFKDMSDDSVAGGDRDHGSNSLRHELTIVVYKYSK